MGESMSEEDSNGLGAGDARGASSNGRSDGDQGAGSQMANKTGSWETLVVFAVNFTRLGVQMNMGNVMGNVV